MSEGHPAAVRQFIEGLGVLCPDAEANLERGGKTSGIWWIDIAAPQTHVVVQWNASGGFSLEEVGEEEPAYGSLPAERYKTVQLALRRMTQLLSDDSQAQAGGVALGELREIHGLTQADLGTKLGIKQAAVSRVERRSDLHLDTLATIIEALGGRLEIRASFPDCEVPVRFASAS